MHPGQAKPKEGILAQPLRVHEVAIEKRSGARRAPYAPRKRQTRMKARDDLPFQPNLELLGMPGMADKLRFPPKIR